MIGQPYFLLAVAHRRQQELLDGHPARPFAPGRGRSWPAWWRAFAGRFLRPRADWVAETRPLRAAGYRR